MNTFSPSLRNKLYRCREQVGGLFERVKETVAERILVKSWLDEETRTQALLKLNSLRGRFHVWPGFHNESLLAREMAEVSERLLPYIPNAIYRYIYWIKISPLFLPPFSTGGDRSGRLFPHRVETVPTDSHRRRQGFEEKRDREVRNLAFVPNVSLERAYPRIESNIKRSKSKEFLFYFRRRRHPYSVNAYYESSTNTIGKKKTKNSRIIVPYFVGGTVEKDRSSISGIPLAMMTAWSWSWDGGPAYAAHATLGSVIGHEILHAFDLHRRRLPLDPDMNVDQWLWITPESWKRLEARIECVARLYARSFWRKVQFYGNDVAVQVGKNIYVYTYVCVCVSSCKFVVRGCGREGWNVFQFDWNVTRNENVADIGALQISYKTWHTLTNGKDRSLPGLEGLRASQLFFISAAQVNKRTFSYFIDSRLAGFLQIFIISHPFNTRIYGDILNSTCRSIRLPYASRVQFPITRGGWRGFLQEKEYPVFSFRVYIRGPISKRWYAQPFRISLHFYVYFFFFYFVVALSKINIRHGGDFLRFLTPHFRTRCRSNILGFFII